MIASPFSPDGCKFMLILTFAIGLGIHTSSRVGPLRTGSHSGCNPHKLCHICMSKQME